MRRWAMAWLVLLLGVCLLPQSASAAPGDVEWTDIIRTDGNVAEVNAVTTHSSGVYAVGVGERKAFVRKYTTTGKLVWARAFHIESSVWLDDVAVDHTGVYVSGGIRRSGPLSCSNSDALVRKYSHPGTLRWTRFISGVGCYADGASDRASGIALDSTGVYVVGDTPGALRGYTNAGGRDIFIRKFTRRGRVLWTRQSGTSGEDSVEDVALDRWGVLIAGTTDGTWPRKTNLGETDAYVRKYSRSGRAYWTRQFGTSDRDSANSITSDGAHFYVGGGTSGTLPGQSSKGDSDGWVRRYRGDALLRWTRQFGTKDADGVVGLDAGAERVYVSGFSYGAFAGLTNKGATDAFVTSYSCTGARRWTRQMGTAGYDGASGIALGIPPGDSQQADRRGLYVGGGLNAFLSFDERAYVRKYEE